MITVLRGERWALSLRDRVAAGAADPFAWMERDTRLLKSDDHSRVGLLELEGSLCHLKCYRPKGPVQALGFRAGRGRGVAAFDNAVLLRRAGLDVPEPRACLRAGGAILLLTEALVEAADLRHLLVEAPVPASPADLLARAGAALAEWHAAGFSHGDCKWSNFLVTPQRMVLVDLEAVSRCNPAGEGPARDLARFTVNAEDMGMEPPAYRAFLDRYCSSMQLDPDAVVRRFLPRVEALRRRHREKYGERGRPLV